MDENGIVAFVSNSSFIDSRTYDGFRKLVAEEFNEIWVIDLKGNARTSGERRRRECGNVFDDQIRVGIAVYFCVRKKGAHGCRIRYQAIRDYAKADEKREFLRTPISIRNFVDVRPDNNHNWINLTDNDFDDFLPIADRKTKLAKAARHERAIFKLFSLGIVTNRDDWAYDDDPRLLKKKISLFCQRVAEERNRWEKAGRPKDTANFVDRTIKWTSELEAHLRRGTTLIFDSKHIVSSLYRPFVKRFTYFAPLITHRPYQNFSLFPDAQHTNVGFSFGF